MAKLTAQLPQSSSPYSPVAPVQSGGDFAGLADALGQGIGLYKEVRAEQRRQEAGAAVGAAQEGILDLEDERNALLLEDQQLAAQVQDIEKDGVTEEEQETLAGLQGQREKLKKARKSGILNPLVFQTRMNALHKSALADVANLAIQPQINAVFQQGRSRIAAPVGSAQKQIEQNMDLKYGVGNWSGADVGREQGKAIYLRQLQADAENSFSTFVGQESIAAMNVYDDAVLNVRRTLAENGALTETDLDAYRGSVNNTTQNLLGQLNRAVAANRAAGTPIDMEMVKNSRQAILDNQQFYLNFMEKGQEFGSNALMQQRLTTMTSILDNINKLKNPALANIATLTGSKGSNGDLLTLAQIADPANQSMLEGVILNLPPELQKTIGVNTLRTQAAQAVALALDGVDMKEAAEAGVVNRRLALAVASVGLRNTSDSAKSNNSYLSSLETTQYQDGKGALDLLNRSDVVTNIRASKADKNKLQAVVIQQIDNLTEAMQGEDFEAISVDAQGNLTYDLQPSSRGRTGGSNRNYMKQYVEALNTTLNTYSAELGGKEQYIKELMMEKEIQTQRDIGPTRTGKAAQGEGSE